MDSAPTSNSILISTVPWATGAAEASAAKRKREAAEMILMVVVNGVVDFMIGGEMGLGGE